MKHSVQINEGICLFKYGKVVANICYPWTKVTQMCKILIHKIIANHKLNINSNEWKICFWITISLDKKKINVNKRHHVAASCENVVWCLSVTGIYKSEFTRIVIIWLLDKNNIQPNWSKSESVNCTYGYINNCTFMLLVYFIFFGELVSSREINLVNYS